MTVIHPDGPPSFQEPVCILLKETQRNWPYSPHTLRQVAIKALINVRPLSNTTSQESDGTVGRRNLLTLCLLSAANDCWSPGGAGTWSTCLIHFLLGQWKAFRESSGTLDSFVYFAPLVQFFPPNHVILLSLGVAEKSAAF